MAISDDDGYFVCDYCGDDTGKFNAETGNHESCEELAKLRIELSALRRVAEAARNHNLMAGPPNNRDGECFFCGGGAMHANYCDYHKWNAELNAALAEYDKCRAE